MSCVSFFFTTCVVHSYKLGPLTEWGLLRLHHVLFLLFLFRVLIQSQTLTFDFDFNLSNREGSFTFVCKSSCQDWQDWYI